MKFIFCYDISSNAIRNKVAKILEKHGIRIQYSIFEIDTTYKKSLEIFKEIKSLINEKTDRIFMYPANKNKNNIKRYGLKRGGKII